MQVKWLVWMNFRVLDDRSYQELCGHIQLTKWFDEMPFVPQVGMEVEVGTQRGESVITKVKLGFDAESIHDHIMETNWMVVAVETRGTIQLRHLLWMFKEGGWGVDDDDEEKMEKLILFAKRWDKAMKERPWICPVCKRGESECDCCKACFTYPCVCDLMSLEKP